MFEGYIKEELEIYYKNIQNSKLKNIIKYSLEGGKCIRGAIVKYLINFLSNKNNNIWQPIVSIELIHGISLIIDDLPCMDNDKIRRNKASTFVQFGERQSILVSLYGISEAFKLLIDSVKNNNLYQDKILLDKILLLINEWNEEIGTNLIFGQMLDLQENIENLLNIKLKNNNKNIMIYKTAALFSFAFCLGALYTENDINYLDFKKMGYYFGIMYQILDDFKDIKTDNILNNYILSEGLNTSLGLYYDSQTNFIDLLNKYNIYTDFFKNIIKDMNSKIFKLNNDTINF